jgi:hypothetical protein
VSGQHAGRQGAGLTVQVLFARVRAELRAERRQLAVERAAWQAEREAAPTGRHAATRTAARHQPLTA